MVGYQARQNVEERCAECHIETTEVTVSGGHKEIHCEIIEHQVTMTIHGCQADLNHNKTCRATAVNGGHQGVGCPSSYTVYDPGTRVGTGGTGQ